LPLFKSFEAPGATGAVSIGEGARFQAFEVPLVTVRQVELLKEVVELSEVGCVCGEAALLGCCSGSGFAIFGADCLCAFNVEVEEFRLLIES
jgi:hypothetical protein